MKRLFSTVLVLMILFTGFQVAVKYFGPGHKIEYKIKTEYGPAGISEKFINTGGNNNYYFEISAIGHTFNYQTFEDFSKADMIIKDLKVYKGNDVSCILPVFLNEKIITDALCKVKLDNFTYASIKGEYSELDNFMNSLNLKNYKVSKFSNSSTKTVEKGGATAYTENIIKGHYVWMNDYKGIFTLNINSLQKLAQLKVFNKDTYKRPLQGTAGNYYLTANYDLEIDFYIFKAVNLTTNEIIEIASNRPISFDSYVQGSFDNSLYIVDRDNERQYQINTRTKKIVEVGNPETGMLLFDGTQMVRENRNDLFTKDQIFAPVGNAIVDGYEKVKVIGDSESGYVYYFKKKGNVYDVYRKNVQANDKLYLFSTDRIDQIMYDKDVIYYFNGDELRYYSDSTGIRTLIKNNEIKFNEAINFGLLVK